MKYWDYIDVERLLALQSGRGEGQDADSNDEVLFIVVHQVYELWMKLLLRELTSARELFREDPVPDQALAAATRSLRRCVTIFELAVDHWRVVETLTTRDYLEFRDKLVGASGFQSAQVRELEILLGLDDAKRIACMGEGSYKDVLRGEGGKTSPALERVEQRIASGPSLKHAVYAWLARTPIDGSTDPAQVEAFVEKYLSAYEEHTAQLLEAARSIAASDDDRARLDERHQQNVVGAGRFLRVTDVDGLDDAERQRLRHVRAALLFIESHRELPRLAWPREVVDTLLVLEQVMVIWRQRHARMVERMIGKRTGTGGSSGVDYLDQTALRYRIFDDIWAVRGLLLRRDLVPPLEHEEDYSFRVQD